VSTVGLIALMGCSMATGGALVAAACVVWLLRNNPMR
jgi:hypothetical protein